MDINIKMKRAILILLLLASYSSYSQKTMGYFGKRGLVNINFNKPITLDYYGNEFIRLHDKIFPKIGIQYLTTKMVSLGISMSARKEKDIFLNEFKIRHPNSFYDVIKPDESELKMKQILAEFIFHRYNSGPSGRYFKTFLGAMFNSITYNSYANSTYGKTNNFISNKQLTFGLAIGSNIPIHKNIFLNYELTSLFNIKKAIVLTDDYIMQENFNTLIEYCRFLDMFRIKVGLAIPY